MLRLTSGQYSWAAVISGVAVNQVNAVNALS